MKNCCDADPIGFAPAEVQIYRDARSFQLAMPDTVDFIKIVDGFIDPTARIETVAFDDGTAWDYNYLVTHATVVASLGGVIIGTPDVDTLTGTSGTDWIYGLASDDTIDGGGGNDFLYGGDGNDALTASAGSNTLDGGSGDDTLVVGPGTNAYGDKNTLIGGAGGDTYTVNHGAPKQDITIVETESNAGETDTLRLPQLNVNQISATSHIAGDVITLRSGTLTLTLPNTNDVNSENNIEQIIFADGTTWDHAALLSHTVTDTQVDHYFQGVAGSLSTPYKSALNAHVFTQVTGDGFYGDDVNFGSDAKDTLYGAWGNDILSGGLNDDGDTLGGGQALRLHRSLGEYRIKRGHEIMARRESVLQRGAL